MKELKTTNPRICNFYKSNPSLNFEAINIIFIELLDKIITDSDSAMRVAVHSQILQNIDKNSTQLKEIHTSIRGIDESVKSLQSGIVNDLIVKFTDIKKGYMEEMQSIVKINAIDTIGPLVERINCSLLEKTSQIIQEVIPKSQGHHFSQLHEAIRYFHKSISDDTKILIKYVDSNTIKEYINNFEMKSTMMLQNIQQPIYSLIGSTEERINSNIQQMKENSSPNIQTNLVCQLSDLLKGCNTSYDYKINGQINVILNKIYSTSEVLKLNVLANISTTSNVYLLKRPNKNKILVQNSDSIENICTDEIKNFLKNIEDNKCNGIFFSHNSGFSEKHHFQIDIHNKMVIVYVHNVEYNSDKIKSATDIIDTLSLKLREIGNDHNADVTIDKDVLEEINKEYQLFMSQKDSITNLLKESHKKVLTQIEELRFPSLDKYLSTKFTVASNKQGFNCDLCRNFSAINLKALAAHKRGCMRKNTTKPLSKIDISML